MPGCCAICTPLVLPYLYRACHLPLPGLPRTPPRLRTALLRAVLYAHNPAAVIMRASYRLTHACPGHRFFCLTLVPRFLLNTRLRSPNCTFHARSPACLHLLLVRTFRYIRHNAGHCCVSFTLLYLHPAATRSSGFLVPPAGSTPFDSALRLNSYHPRAHTCRYWCACHTCLQRFMQNTVQHLLRSAALLLPPRRDVSAELRCGLLPAAHLLRLGSARFNGLGTICTILYIPNTLLLVHSCGLNHSRVVS